MGDSPVSAQWKHLHNHPPALCRLFARRRETGKGVTAMSLREIAIGSGLPLDRVTEIANQVSWAGVTIDEAEKFIAGCRFDPFSHTDRNRKNAYTRSCRRFKTKFLFLRKHPHWKTELLPLIRRLQSRLAS